ncbi:MAG: cysteine desulfurase family protein [Caldisericota bacterium]|nr:cysteine desulfurase family protein [Caldisericota bacterium]
MSRIIYLDHAATTPVDKRVFKKMKPYFTELFANPATRWTSSISKKVDEAIEEARKNVAVLINALPEEIIFTSGGTESDNTALKGVAFANKDKGNEIITTPIEHEAVLKTAESLQDFGFVIKYVPVDREGFIDPDDVKKLITSKTILVSIMHANNEIGTIEPIREIGAICREKNVLFHTDAVQTIAHLPVDVEQMNIDLLSLSSHKFYGPKGVGALYIREGVPIAPYMDGGGQERGFRSGTLNSVGIIGLGEAAKLGKEEQKQRENHIAKLRDIFLARILEEISAVYLNGPEGDRRLPGNISIIIPGIRNEPLLVILNEKGIIAGGGSACSASKTNPSHVLQAIGIPEEDIFSVVRITIGKDNKQEDIDFVVKNIKEVTNQLRALSPFWRK